jgi:DNA-binding transcriptional LysR family regulator
MDRPPPLHPSPSLYYLRTFQAVATERSFTRAARALDLSQPAVSAHIRSLEQYYGTKLLETRSRRVHLTAEGAALYAYTRRAFNLIHLAGEAVAATRRAETGVLRLAASATVGIYLLPTVLGRFSREHPSVEIDVVIGSTADVAAGVLAENAPFGLVEAPVSHPDLVLQPIGHDDMVLVAPPGHALAQGQAARPADLTGRPLLRRESGSGSRALVDAALQRAGIVMPTQMQLGSPEALKQAVLAGLGLAWVPRLSITRELARGELAVISVANCSVPRTLSLLTRRDTRLATVVAPFLALVRTTAAALGTAP